MLKFKTDFLVEDYSTLCWLQAKKINIVLSVLVGFAFGFTVFGITQMPIVGGVVFAVCAVVFYMIQKKNTIKRAERRFCAYPTSSELELTVSDAEILQVSNSGETRLAWQDVYGVCESDVSYYIYLAKGKAFYFPKRSFESDEQKREFLDYIKKYVPEKKIKIKK